MWLAHPSAAVGRDWLREPKIFSISTQVANGVSFPVGTVPMHFHNLKYLIEIRQPLLGRGDQAVRVKFESSSLMVSDI